MTEGATTDRKLAAIMIADVAGFSRLMERDESLTFARLRRLREEINFPKVEDHGGRIIKTTGDGFLAEFGSATAAVRCGIDIQRSICALEAIRLNADRIQFRIGINVGDVIVDGEDVAGDGVNIAARLEPLSPVNGICISASVREQIRDDLGVSFEDMGEQTLKNISRTIRAFALRLDANSPPAAATHSPTPMAAVTKPRRLSIVVLPFTNASGDPAQEYFSDGVTDEVTAQLSKIRGSYVISRDTAFAYKGKPIDLKALGLELGVRYVLRGSVERFEGGVDTSVQLVDSLSGSIVWTDTIQVDLHGVRNIRREVVSRLAIALNREWVIAEAQRSLSENCDSPDASDLVLQGLAKMNASDGSLASFIAARALFDRALAIQKDHQPALSFRASVISAHAFAYPSPNNATLIAQAETDVLHALRLDSLDPYAHFVLSRVRFLQKRKEAALAACNNALELDGNLVRAYAWQGCLLICNGQPELTPDVIDKALTQSPRDPNRNIWLFWKGWAYNHQGKFDDAIVWLEKSSFWIAQLVLAGSYFLNHQADMAKAVKEQLLSSNPEISVSFCRQYFTFSDNANFVERQERIWDSLTQLGIPD